MRELVKSAVSFSWAMAVFAWSRIGRLLFPSRDATLTQEAAAFGRIAQAALAALEPQPRASAITLSASALPTTGLPVPAAAPPVPMFAQGPAQPPQVNSGGLDIR